MQIQTPDIGVDKALVAEILVKVGDHVAVDDSLWCWSPTKQRLKCQALQGRHHQNILVQQGDEVTEGVALIELESESAAETSAQDANQSQMRQSRRKTCAS